MLWQSKPSVIVGKHQNVLKEVNTGYTQKKNIPVIRRISGGGTVYHDPGNLNYTVITTETNREKLIDFRKFTKPVIAFLETLGIRAEFEGKNNLVISGKKFSGNSAHVFKNRVMHHGTLLFNTDLDVLDKTIHPELKDKIQDKAVQSIWATVTNIRDLLDTKPDIDVFKVNFQNYLLNYYSIKEIRELNKTDIQAIKKLIEDKYKTWEWNFGYSPVYVFRNEIQNIKVELKVKNGKIVDICFAGEVEKKEKLERLLRNIPHREEDIKKVIYSEYGEQNTVDEIIRLLSPVV